MADSAQQRLEQAQRKMGSGEKWGRSQFSIAF